MAERISAVNPFEMKVLKLEDFWETLNAELMDGSVTRGSQHIKQLQG